MSDLALRPPKPRSSGYCHHCMQRTCVWPTCEDIAKAHKDGYTDAEIIAVLKKNKTGDEG